jgi:hypothetical protein
VIKASEWNIKGREEGGRQGGIKQRRMGINKQPALGFMLPYRG